jgi:hypothetical protein
MAHYTPPHEADDYFPLVNTNEENNNKGARDEQPRPKRKSLWERADPISFLVMFLGSVLLFLVLLLLAYFWKLSMMENTTEQPNATWVHIINANLGTRLVTICTTIIRTVVTFQASLATAMVAGILMETTGIPLLQGPFYSIVRALQVAPSNLLTSANFWPHNLLSFFVYILVIFEVIFTITSQFLSTIFLSDFADGTFNQMNSTYINVLNSSSLGYNGLWKMPPTASWTLAELSEPFIEGPNFHDTGHTYRAFIPFGVETQRTRLRKFHGPVSIVDQRVFCASPTLLNLSLDSRYLGLIRLSGQMTIDSTSYPGLQDIRSQSSINFTCQLQDAVYETDTPQGDTSICFLNRSDDWSVLLKDPLVESVLGENPGGGPIFEDSMIFMILDMLSMVAIRNATAAKHVVQTVRNDGPWAIITNGSDVEAIRVSACMTNMGSKTAIADIHSLSDNIEPEISWDHHTQSYNTENVRRQLGASKAPDSPKDRGVLVLGPKSQWQTLESIQNSDGMDIPKEKEIFTTSFFSNSLLVSLPSGRDSVFSDPDSPASQGVILSQRLYSDSWSAHPTHASIFQDTLNDTESPALALQVMLARICQMAYYDELVRQDIRAIASISLSSHALMPMRWTGFAIGTAIIVSHLIIVTILAAMFIKYTNYSCIGSYWQAVSQIISEDTRPVLEQADKMKDNEIKLWAKQHLHDVKSSTFLRYRQNGRVSLGISEHCER